MKSKVKKMRTVYFVLYNLIILILVTVFIKLLYSKMNTDNMTELDYEYNIITLSATLGGFLFTGISILISVIDKKSIKPYWDGHYLDSLNLSAFIGIIAFLITIIISLCAVIFDVVRENEYVIKAQIYLTVVGIANFAFAIEELVFVIRKLKDNE